MPFLSVVSPVYNTGAMLPELVHRLQTVVPGITNDFEIILIDDGSSDRSWEEICSLAVVHNHLKGIKLSRNFGQHAAIFAGLHCSAGDWTVVMDSDLQDPPEVIASLYLEAGKGFSIVSGKRNARTDSFFRQLASKLFYRIFSRLSGFATDYAIANFGLYSRKVIDAVIALEETNPFFPMAVNRVGFKKTTIHYNHGMRSAGASGYSLKKLYRLALNVTLSYSNRPLRYAMNLGFLISAVTFIYGIIVLSKYYMGKISVLGYTSLILSVWFLGGIVLFSIGITGLYIGKIFEEVKGRAMYIVEETVNDSL